MGLFRALIISGSSIAIVNLIESNKKQLSKHPLMKQFLPYFNNYKCHAIIIVMIFFMILW